jgi:hypothetical protein
MSQDIGMILNPHCVRGIMGLGAGGVELELADVLASGGADDADSRS